MLDRTYDYVFDVSRDPYTDNDRYVLIQKTKPNWVTNPDYDKQLAEYEKYENEYALYSENIDKHNAEVKRLNTEAAERIEFERLNLNG